MALFIQKALLWNTNGYQSPSGVKAGGFPNKTGFGFEEWNNSPHLKLRSNGEDLRVFHTHEVGALDVDKYAGEIFVFMTASHHNQQVLVGVAGHATSLNGPQHKRTRLDLVKGLRLDALKKAAWNAPTVQQKFSTRDAFHEMWAEELQYLPRWLCPEPLFWWPAEPIPLDPIKITGQKKLLQRFKGYATFDREQVRTIMNSTPDRQRDATWMRLMAALRAESNEAAPHEPPPLGLDVTSRMALVACRLRQADFRRRLDEYWSQRCAVTGSSIRALLRASHIVPWSQASDTEKTDPENGLLLAAHLDALFDAALISFADDGSMILSNVIDNSHKKELGLPRSLRKRPSLAMRQYLARHRERMT